MTEAPGVLDYSFAHPDLSLIPPSVKGVARYLRGSLGKPLTAVEAGAIHATGRFIVVNDETTAGDAANGGEAGQKAGVAAGAAARALGIPSSCVIHPSVDFDVTSDKQMAAVEQYMQAYHQASGYGQGAYGEADVIDALADQGLLTTGCGWQASAWSHGRVSSHAAMLQYLNGQSVGGAAVDFNRLINVAGLGAWFPTRKAVMDFIGIDTSSGQGYLFTGGVKVPQTGASFAQLQAAGVARIDIDPADVNLYPTSGALETQILTAIADLAKAVTAPPAVTVTVPPIVFPSFTVTPEAS